MLEGGENPLYIARRLVRFASEDVGLADPLALPQAVACYQACHFLGMPECNVNLAQCVAYLSLAPKSVAVYQGIVAAQRMVKEKGQNEPVPLHLRNAPTKLMKDIGYGKGYIYPPSHSSPTRQEYLPPSLAGYKFLNWPEENMSK
jgi:putative ATPase